MSEAIFHGNWADQSFIPFTIRTDYLKVLGIWFSEAGACAKTSEEPIIRFRQKLVFCEHCSLFIAGGKKVPNTVLILMTTFVCGCIQLCVDPQYRNTKCHYVLRIYLSPVLQKMALASLLWNAPSSWTIPYCLSFVEKFAKKNTFDHKSIRKWSVHSILETLWEKERVYPVGLFPEQTVKVIWQNDSSPELSNKHQDIAWLVSKVLTLIEGCRLAHSNIQDHMLKGRPKAAATKDQWGKTTFSGLSAEVKWESVDNLAAAKIPFQFSHLTPSFLNIVAHAGVQLAGYS
eukprot:g47595.t1